MPPNASKRGPRQTLQRKADELALKRYLLCQFAFHNCTSLRQHFDYFEPEALREHIRDLATSGDDLFGVSLTAHESHIKRMHDSTASQEWVLLSVNDLRNP